MVTQQQQYQEIQERVRKISAFYQHLIVYILVNIGLVIINLASGDGIWFIYPLLGWGFGVAMHGMKVFLAEGWAKSWEEKKIRELLEKEGNAR